MCSMLLIGTMTVWFLNRIYDRKHLCTPLHLSAWHDIVSLGLFGSGSAWVPVTMAAHECKNIQTWSSLCDPHLKLLHFLTACCSYGSL